MISMGMVSQATGLIFLVFLPEIAPLLSISTKGIGLLLSCGAWGGLIASVFLALRASRSHTVSLMRVWYALTGLFLFIAALASNAAWLMIALAGIGIGRTGAAIVLLIMLPRLFPRSPRRIISFHLAAVSLITVILPVTAGLLLAWSRTAGISPLSVVRIAFLCGGLILLGGCCLFTGKTAEKSCMSKPARSKFKYLKASFFPALICALHGGTDSAIVPWMQPFFTLSFKEHFFPPAWILSGYGVSYLIGRTLLSVLPEGKKENLLLVCPGIAGGSLFLASFLSVSYSVSAALFVCASFICGLQYPVLVGMISREMPKQTQTVLSLSTILTFLLMGCLVFAVGWIAGRTGNVRTGMLILPIGYIAFSAASIVWLRRQPENVDRDKK
jgi:predicted MFS family arabinose efflux permease